MTCVDPAIGAANEEPVFFEAGGETLFGLLTRPNEPSESAVVLMPGGDYIPSLNRNRVWVRLSRLLAAEGVNAFRFDWHGVGESTGLVEHFELGKPFTLDLEEAVRWLRRQGVRRFVFVGVCFGAATALASASGVTGLRGLVLISHPVIENEVLETHGAVAYLRNLLHEEGLAGLVRRSKRAPAFLGFLGRRLQDAVSRGARRARVRVRGDGDVQPASRRFVRQVERVLERRVPVLLVYGRDSSEHAEFERARRGRLEVAIAAAGDRFRVVTLEGPVHELARLDVQDEVVELTRSWIRGLEAAAS